jgi:hypothetical protein
MKRRYPGPMPFSYDDRSLFFGRDAEIDYLTTLIINNQITILHGKSGYGKSSLLNAGIIPSLLETFNCEIIRIRFYNYDKSNPLRPLDTFLNTIKHYVPGRLYLDGIISADHVSAWRYFKTMQYEGLKKCLHHEGETAAPQLSYILVIDQFEELFTYPKEAVIELAKEFHETLLHRIPEEYHECLKDSFRSRENLEEHKDELNILDKDLPLKIIFSLRTERFNYLTHLVHYIPTLLNNTYKVRRLTGSQVQAAIVGPAQVAGTEFHSPPFIYDETIVTSLIAFLRADTRGQDAGKVEAFELQIICQKLEEILVHHLAARNADLTGESPIRFTEEIIQNSAFIKDKEAPYAEIIKNYYKETIETIPEPVEQLSARFLIEYKLIDSATSNRISLDNAFVKQIGIPEAVLDHLIDKRIIRLELNTVSGHSLEISHDSLVQPILGAASELGSLDGKLASFYEESINAVSKEGGKKVRAIINNVLLEEKEEKKAAASELTAEDFTLLRVNPVITERSPNKGTDDIQAFAVKKIFLQTAQQSRARSHQTSTRSWVRRFAIISVILVAVVGLSLFILSGLKHRTDRISALYFLCDKIGSITNKEHALLLTEYIRQERVLNPDDLPILKTAQKNLFLSQDVQALFGYYSTSIPGSNLKREEIALSHNGDFSIYNYKSSDGDAPWGRYYFCDKQGNILRQFERILYTYFTNRKDVAILAKASAGSDSVYSGTNKLAGAFVLFNCKTGDSVSITLEQGHYLYPPDYGAPYEALNNDSYRVHFNNSGSLVVPVYDPVKLVKSQQTTTLSGTAFNQNTFSIDTPGVDNDDIRLPQSNNELEDRIKEILQDGTREFAGVNRKKNSLLYKIKEQYKNGPETLWRNVIGVAGGQSFTYAAGIQSTVYNEQADATLVYTKDNRLYLLDSALHTKAGFQLTANDLYGFSKSGNHFFYVQNEALSFFDNNERLINLFDYEQGTRWLQTRFENAGKATLQKLKKDYKLDF